MADYSVICTGNSQRQLEALLEAVEATIRRQRHRFSARIEGHPTSGWVLADLGNIIVHIFSEEKRRFYRLEELWREAKVIIHIQ